MEGVPGSILEEGRGPSPSRVSFVRGTLMMVVPSVEVAVSAVCTSWDITSTLQKASLSAGRPSLPLLLEEERGMSRWSQCRTTVTRPLLSMIFHEGCLSISSMLLMASQTMRGMAVMAVVGKKKRETFKEDYCCFF